MNKPKRSACPLACTLDVIGDRWTLIVIRDLALGRASFKQLCDSPEGIATNILAERLHRLIAAGLVERFSSTDGRSREGYRLTARGRTLLPILDAIAQWGSVNIKGTEPPPKLHVD